MGKTRKYYVVWQGLHPGVYNNWEDCKEQVEGQSGAKYKAFESREAAEEAFANGYESYIQKNPTPKMVFEKMMKEKTPVIGRPINNSLAVDAACSGNPGDMEYRGVYTATGQEIFSGPRPRIGFAQTKKLFHPDLFGQPERDLLGKEQEMQDLAGTFARKRTDIRSDCPCRKMATGKYIYNPYLQMGNVRLGRNPCRLRKKIKMNF